ncbi:ABC transporter substrate-binding protein [Vibrio atypicus]|uniref:ABC transporter substrate-binding protein n=1 Tax=Vibrio atypicus TaxID=558271 RepID=UPI00135B1560|nr:ABC transporter substrate-binding protein [Vibrio atypicus]
MSCREHHAGEEECVQKGGFETKVTQLKDLIGLKVPLFTVQLAVKLIELWIGLRRYASVVTQAAEKELNEDLPLFELTHIFKGFCDVRLGSLNAIFKVVFTFWSLLVSSTVLANKEDLVILTTFSSEPIAELMFAYKQENPKVDIKLIHRRTQSAIQLLNKSYIQDVDVVLSSSPFLMEELHKREQLAEVSMDNELPDWLIPFVLPKRSQVISVGYSGAGLVWNNDYLHANGLKEPSQFRDLTSVDYFGHITMSTPSRSGTTQMMIESLLAQYGWQQGWEIILNVGANLGTISSRSFGVSDNVAKGQFGIGPIIDSYALVLPKQFQHVGFGYDKDFTLMPTYIGVLKKSGNNKTTQRFIELLLSKSVQTDMHQTSFAKHSIGDDSLFSAQIPTLNLNQLMMREKLVNIIFDEAITKRLPELQDVWLSLSHHETSDKTSDEVIRSLKKRLFTISVSELDVMALGQSILEQTKSDPRSNGLEQAMLAEFGYRFGSQFESNLEQVAEQLNQLKQGSFDE